MGRRGRNSQTLHEALDAIAPDLFAFVDQRIDSDALWAPFREWFEKNEERWDAEADERLQDFFFIVESCVPAGFVPDPDRHEIDETELRRLIRELLVEAGYEPPDPLRS